MSAPAFSPRRAFRAACLAVLAMLLAGVPVAGSWASDKEDHDRARAAVQAGDILPLARLMEQLQRSHPGRVLEVELEREKNLWIYEMKILQADGRLLKLKVDARTGAVLRERVKR